MVALTECCVCALGMGTNDLRQHKVHLACIRAAGSNLQMVRPSLMSVVKPPIIRVQACGKILDLAIFSSQEALPLHFSFKLGVTIQIALLSSTGPQQIKATLY